MRYITLYHGTRADPSLIRSEGLKGIDLDTTLDKVLAHFGIKRTDPVPHWVWQIELKYRREEYKGTEVQLSTSKEQAASYSYMGGEYEYMIGTRILQWRHPRWSRERVDKEYFKEYRPGKRLVVTVRVPWDRIQPEQQAKIMTLEAIEPLEKWAYLVRVPYVPPSDIIAIEEVDSGSPSSRGERSTQMVS